MKSVIRNESKRVPSGRRLNGGFTLVELLVVVAIIVVLLALLMPALDKAMTAAVHAQCGAQQHGLLGIIHGYAVENSRRYPSGLRDGPGEEAFQVSTGFVKLVESYVGNNNAPERVDNDPVYGEFRWGVSPRILTDPEYKEFGYQNAYGWLIGYYYLGGRPGLTSLNKPPTWTENWDSPMGLAKPGSGQLVACVNHWYEGSRVWVAHSESGPIGEGTNWFYTANADPRSNGSLGGNIARTDGSVEWTKTDKMTQYISGAVGIYGLW